MIDWTKPIMATSGHDEYVTRPVYLGEEEDGIHAVAMMRWGTTWAITHCKASGKCHFRGNQLFVNVPEKETENDE